MDPMLQIRALAELADLLRATPGPMSTAEEVVDYARRQLDADYAGITLLRRGGQFETVAPTHPVVVQVDALQYELSQGPCLESAWEQQTMVSQDLSADRRWPAWSARAASEGIGSVLSVELVGGNDRRIGAVNNYWAEPRIFTRDEVAFANLFARQAGLALHASMEIADLNVALDSRKRIGQAQGILMARYDLDEDRAFEVLRRYSRDRNIKLRDVAEQVVANRGLLVPGSGSAES